ncbi:LTA synthase family protein [Enterococcus faecium]|uniref:LTA synthase family protein n=1 Tax=Enterococcus faecium TaxID=1352 RepID=UPI000A32F492|nr:LTA synthase family protein [Enterococcus faecium]EGP4758287.1 LTA synthase family protein [Enterococcus faecium]EGP4982710.1 LTA synthase family protein [Enterococcus faecium]EGP5415267.1 LTA synthase family protein [Enterococcus faecium]EGP5711354.1 LTA synthase family protein [Enterococcus faecium]EGP5720584.1 LTA synthase family protein [Enterococcus faecium]
MKRYISRLSTKQKKILKGTATIISIFFLVVFSNLFLQWCQNDLSVDLALKFAFSWHTEKFFLACLVLLIILIFLIALAGSVPLGSLTYVVTIGVLGFANYMKMSYRQEPIYPDDLKMITEIGLLKDMTGTMLFTVILAAAGTVLGLFCWYMFRSLKKGRRFQLIRLTTLLVAIGLLGYISNFNNPDNLLRKAYNKTALWIPYSQKMNYYNTGFIGGFLYNLKVEPMDEPEGYSKAKIKEITEKYQKLADEKNKAVEEESPNIVFVMSESFSDPSRLNGVEVSGEPLADYYEVADQTYSGNMLSQNYGGGTANIEFEALTGFSMALFNAQLTTPYTMLVPKMDQLPSIVSALNAQSYQTTAIHPYNTSMYKREDVYQTLGFDQFISERTMTYTDTIENNPYISDESAYKEVMTLLKEEKAPQFIHLVTMQTHMPYNGKYDRLGYSAEISDGSGTLDLENYLQDISYSSTALKQFTEELKNLSRRTLVVFWGDHLPGIYSDTIQAKNDKQTLHETQFLMFDSKGKLEKQTTQDAITSPFYFAANLMEQTNQTTNGFYQLLLSLEQELPAFERELYYQNGQWYKEAQFNRSQQEIYDEYQLIQYDIVAGKQYSLADGFFEHE